MCECGWVGLQSACDPVSFLRFSSRVSPCPGILDSTADSIEHQMTYVKKGGKDHIAGNSNPDPVELNVGLRGVGGFRVALVVAVPLVGEVLCCACKPVVERDADPIEPVDGFAMSVLPVELVLLMRKCGEGWCMVDR